MKYLIGANCLIVSLMFTVIVASGNADGNGALLSGLSGALFYIGYRVTISLIREEKEHGR